MVRKRTEVARTSVRKQLSIVLALALFMTVLVAPNQAEAAELRCNGKSATVSDLIGTGGDDVIIGTPQNDIIRGFKGNDTICGMGGNDIIWGGEGNDVIQGGDGQDTIHGQNGADSINGQTGNDTIYAGGGNDKVWGSDGDDEIHGGPGVDSLSGGNDNDEVRGGDGNDSVNGNAGNDYVNGGVGDDAVYGGAGEDEIHGGNGNDKLYGSYGHDTIYSEAGNDMAWGQDGDDEIHGGPGVDSLSGGNGTDTIRGGPDNDSVNGDAGDDKVYGADGNDNVYGGVGEDQLHGGNGNDKLYGGDGNDNLKGDAGYDSANGNTGTDQCEAETETNCVQAPLWTYEAEVSGDTLNSFWFDIEFCCVVLESDVDYYHLLVTRLSDGRTDPRVVQPYELDWGENGWVYRVDQFLGYSFDAGERYEVAISASNEDGESESISITTPPIPSEYGVDNPPPGGWFTEAPPEISAFGSSLYSQDEDDGQCLFANTAEAVVLQGNELFAYGWWEHILNCPPADLWVELQGWYCIWDAWGKICFWTPISRASREDVPSFEGVELWHECTDMVRVVDYRTVLDVDLQDTPDPDDVDISRTTTYVCDPGSPA